MPIEFIVSGGIVSALLGVISANILARPLANAASSRRQLSVLLSKLKLKSRTGSPKKLKEFDDNIQSLGFLMGLSIEAAIMIFVKRASFPLFFLGMVLPSLWSYFAAPGDPAPHKSRGRAGGRTGAPLKRVSYRLLVDACWRLSNSTSRLHNMPLLRCLQRGGIVPLLYRLFPCGSQRLVFAHKEAAVVTDGTVRNPALKCRAIRRKYLRH